MKTFANCIRDARQNKGYSQRDLARLLKVDYTYISKLENEQTKHPPKEKRIKLLAHYLELDAEELIYLAGRITAADAEIIKELAKTHQKQMPVLLRLMRDKSELVQKFVASITNY